MTSDPTVIRLAGSMKERCLLLAGPSQGTAVIAQWGRCSAYLGGQLEVAGGDLSGHGIAARPQAVRRRRPRRAPYARWQSPRPGERASW